MTFMYGSSAIGSPIAVSLLRFPTASLLGAQNLTAVYSGDTNLHDIYLQHHQL